MRGQIEGWNDRYLRVTVGTRRGWAETSLLNSQEWKAKGGGVKLHRVLAEGCGAVLGAVLLKGEVLDRVLERAFQSNPRWGKRDRAFVAETVFEVVRWRRALAFVADSGEIPALCAAQWTRMGMEIPAWWSWSGVAVQEMSARELALQEQPRAIRESIPDWLDARGMDEMSDRWEAEIAALNRRAPITLRVNTLLGDRDAAAAWLLENGVATDIIPELPDALMVRQGRISKPLLATGRIEIQDAGSQRITPLLELEPGMRFLDACAGAGGKTLHAAALMRNEGKILALDIHERRLHELERRAKQARASVRTSLWTPQTLKDLMGWADCVLIDAPCSGLGTVRRQPDLKWRLTVASLEKTRRLQQRLLDDYASLLRPGGQLVYATCSILPSENEAQVAGFIDRHPDWSSDKSLVISPASDGSDGLYAARIRKGD
jgi:16S rRNA (cytosine967-C5)-methyltransferase